MMANIAGLYSFGPGGGGGDGESNRIGAAAYHLTSSNETISNQNLCLNLITKLLQISSFEK